jgi:protocadherin-16/23
MLMTTYLHSRSCTTNAVFDYETRTNYRFKIRATDVGGNTAVIAVLVNIESMDEYAPRFLQTSYNFVVRGNAKVGDVVGHVQAQDDDGGEDGRIFFSFSESNDYFGINGTTGIVFVKRSFNDQRRRKRWVNRYTHRVILGRSKRSLDKDSVQLKIRASSGKVDSKSIEVVAEVAINRTCPGCDVVAPVPSGLTGTPLVLAIVFAVIGVIIVVVTALLCFRSRKTKRRPPPPQRHHDTSFDPVHVHGILMSPDQPPLTAREEAPPRYNDIHHYPGANCITSELSDQSHSASSGRGSVEDNEDDDEEIRIINSGPLSQSQNLQRKGMPDSGIQQDDDNISEHSVRNHKDYLAKLGIDVSKIKADTKPAGLTQSVESMHQFSEEGGGEGDGMDIGNIIYQKLSEMDSSDDLSSMMTGSAELIHVFDETAAPSHGGSLSSVINSEEEFSGSYNWDYLLDWGPQYQPLADVFTEIARLKDENIQPKKQPVTQIVPLRPSQGPNSGVNKVKLYPPPMITDMPPVPALSSVPSKPSSTHSSHTNSTVSQATTGPQRPNKNNPPPNHSAPPIPFSPRSPITHDTSFQSPAYTPSFTPSLSPLGVRTPAIPGYNMPQRGAPSHSSGHSSTHSAPNRTKSDNSLSHLSGSEQEFRI